MGNNIQCIVSLKAKTKVYHKYHRQGDVPYSDIIAHYLNYIYELDRFKQAERNRQMLESQNAGYRQLCVC